MTYNLKAKIPPDGLRDMIDKPVMIYRGKGAENFRMEWDIIKRVGENAVETLRGSVFMIQDYDNSWAAFPYNPELSMLDYKSCVLCSKGSILQGHVEALERVKRGHMQAASFDGGFEFCPLCGRPLTHDAVRLLNKHLGGAK